jgi:hypothetical protein
MTITNRTEDASEELLRYAPRWARHSPPIVPALDAREEHSAPAAPSPSAPPEPSAASAPPADRGTKNPDPGPPPSLQPFEGDIAIQHLRRHLSIDPDLVPQPPIRGECAPSEPWIGKFSLMLLLAATVGFGTAFLTISHRQQGAADAAAPAREGPAASELRSARDRLLDGRSARLEWAPRQEARLTLEPAEVAALTKRAEHFLESGDIASARLVLARAAGAGDARAALTLGGTFDPGFLAEKDVSGLAPDLDQARNWYKQAADLGSDEASQRLVRLTQLITP